ncbi:hypothetical protein K2X30_11295 [bacterium]|nr:hypothetical protein [bacterium]
MQPTHLTRSSWNIREATAQHYQWFKNMAELHEITLNWLEKLGMEKPGHLLQRGVSPDIADTLGILERISEQHPGTKDFSSPDHVKKSLDALLDDTDPEDLLSRLEHTVEVVQAWTLAHILGQTKDTNRIASRNQLEQVAWNSGRHCSKTRWKNLGPHQRGDLRNLLMTYRNSPLSGYPYKRGLLVKRAAPEEIWLELLNCPHRSARVEVKTGAHDLCLIHRSWTQGFLYELNSRVIVDHQVSDDPTVRCEQRWTLLR